MSERFPFFADQKLNPYPIHDFREKGLSPAERLVRAQGAIDEMTERLKDLSTYVQANKKAYVYAQVLAEEWAAAAKHVRAEAEAVIRAGTGQRDLRGRVPRIPIPPQIIYTAPEFRDAPVRRKPPIPGVQGTLL